MGRRAWPPEALAGPLPGVKLCWLCQQPMTAALEERPSKGRFSGICDRPRCAAIRQQLYDVVTRGLRKERCSICPALHVEGSKYCETHQFKKAPCKTPECPNRVRRSEGGGAQPEYCEACGADRARAKGRG